MGGIVEVEQKIDVFIRLFDVGSKQELVNLLAPGAGTRFDKYRTPHGSMPTGANFTLWNQALHRLKLHDSHSVQWLMDCTVKELVFELPESMRRKVSATTHDAPDDEVSIVIDTSALVDDLRFNPELDRRLDQKFIYQSGQSARHWKELITYDDYATFRHCMESLGDFVNDDWWQSLVREGHITSVVILGAGSGDKEARILASLERHIDRRFRVIIVDLSFHMLLETIRHLNLSRAKGRFRNSDITYVVGDFMKLESMAVVTKRAAEGRTAFFMPGATITNIDERTFLSTLRATCHEGDLLVAGLELFDQVCTSDDLKVVVSEYEHDHLRRLMGNSVQLLLGHDFIRNRHSGSVALRDIVRSEGLLNAGPDITPIDGTSAVLITVTLAGKSFEIATTKRYQLGSFCDFMRAFKFHHLEHATIRSRGNLLYRQAVFEWTNSQPTLGASAKS